MAEAALSVVEMASRRRCFRRLQLAEVRRGRQPLPAPLHQAPSTSTRQRCELRQAAVSTDGGCGVGRAADVQKERSGVGKQDPA